MWRTVLEALGTIRDAIGRRGTLVLVLLALLAVPLLLAVTVCALPLWLVGWAGSRALNALRGVGERRDDPVFGPVTYWGSSTWYAERELEALGGTFSISVTGPRATGPGPDQHELLRGLIARQHDIRRQAEGSLYREYLAVAPRCRGDTRSPGRPDVAATLLEGLPALEGPAQIWALLSDGSILLDDEPGRFSVFWNCPWDEEHGVSRTFVDWTLEEDEDG